MMRARGITGLVLVMVALHPATTAWAQGSSAESALAEALYRQGRQLMGDGKYGEACPKFAESYRLDPATGTLLNLATCHEGQQKLATAWLEYTEAASLARRDQREDRVRFAQERLAALEPKLARLTVDVPVAADIPALEVRVDGALVRAAARGVPTPVDPGLHQVEARAPGRKPWSQRVGVSLGTANIVVTVPVLETEPAATIAPSNAALAVGASTPHAPTSEKPSRPVPASVFVVGAFTIGRRLEAPSPAPSTSNSARTIRPRRIHPSPKPITWLGSAGSTWGSWEPPPSVRW